MIATTLNIFFRPFFQIVTVIKTKLNFSRIGYSLKFVSINGIFHKFDEFQRLFIHKSIN